MSGQSRNILAVFAVVGWIPSLMWAQQPQPHESRDDASHREMMARGAHAMGFDQERAVHHFQLDQDGGAIEVSVRAPSDHASLHAVRQHLQEIVGLFKAGDFGKPELTHAQPVPGTADMRRLKERIAYQYEETTSGGRLRIVTRDPDAVAAVHAFLRFQVEDHRTGDAGHGAATAAQMGDIHELFLNHDRITRSVTNLPDGIRTVTESSDPRIAQLLRDHVASMGQRVQTGNDLRLPIESQALRSIFQNYDKIRTTVENTATGLVVIQTSSDKNTVAALQQHASEVTDFVRDGMAAMHNAMMRNRGGMMRRDMHGSMSEGESHSQTAPSPR